MRGTPISNRDLLTAVVYLRRVSLP
jgi:hypothetical protein